MATPVIRHGVESIIGRRKTMEDRHVALDSLNNEYPEIFSAIPQKCSFYAVYDGHGGVEAAAMCEQLLHPSILGDPAFASGDIDTAIRNGFRITDDKILKDSHEKQWQAGSTAVIAMVVGQTLHVANLGDSEMVVAKRSAADKFEPIVVSVKHKPTDESEKERIKKAGGMVVRGRIFGMLAVSRSFGDRDYKHPYNDVDDHFVSNDPHVLSLELGSEHSFMVLSCDGLWDKMTYEDVINSVAAAREQGLSPTDAAKLIVQAASDRGSLDNISAVVVYLPFGGGAVESATAGPSSPPSALSSSHGSVRQQAPRATTWTPSEDELADRILRESNQQVHLPPPRGMAQQRVGGGSEATAAAAAAPSAAAAASLSSSSSPSSSAAAPLRSSQKATPLLHEASMWSGSLNVAQLKERFPGLSVDLLEVMLDVDLRVIHLLLEHVPSPEFDKTSAAALALFDSVAAVLPLLRAVITAEVQTTTEPNTLFRASTAGCKLVSDYSSLIGWEFLKKTLTRPLEKIRDSKSTFEIDPNRLGKDETATANAAALLNACEDVLAAVLHSAQTAPPQLREVFASVKQAVAEKFPDCRLSAVSAFVFLRFFSPFIVAPDKIMTVAPKDRRKLILVSKILQSAANGAEFGEKEAYMKAANSFVVKHKGHIEHFLENISTTLPNAPPPSPSPPPANNAEKLADAAGVLQRQLTAHKDAVLNTLPPAARQEVAKVFQYMEIEKKEISPSLTYAECLQRATADQTPDAACQQAIYLAGNTSEGRPIVVCDAQHVNTEHAEKFLIYTVGLLETVVDKEYELVLIHSPVARPRFNWLRQTYSHILPKKYKKNLKALYFVHANRWLKFMVLAFRSFASSKFWAKVRYVDSVEDLHSSLGLTAPIHPKR